MGELIKAWPIKTILVRPIIWRAIQAALKPKQAHKKRLTN